ncbi:MAG: STAS/SEC14 domain-containing protein [Bacteroidota bacterium]
MVQINLDTNLLLESINSLDTASLESFAREVNLLVAKRKAPTLAEQESHLLLEINKGLPQDLLETFQKLQQQSKDRLLSSSEDEQLAELVEKIELQEASRLEAMIQLAQIRRISLNDLRIELGIQPNIPNG